MPTLINASHTLPVLIDRSTGGQKSRALPDFGPVEIGIEVDSVDQNSSANLYKGKVTPKDEIPNGPIRNPEIAGGVLLGE